MKRFVEQHECKTEPIPFVAEFSTQSAKLSGKTVTRLILNADGIYLSSYAALHLNLKLSLDGHYKVHHRFIIESFIRLFHGD